MRILHVIQSLDPKSGGPPAIAMRLAAAQAQSGCRVTLAASIPDPSTSSNAVPGWELVACRCGDDASGPALDKLIAATDVVHIHGVWDSLLRRSAAAAYRHGVPHVIAPHGMLDPWSLDQKRLKKKMALALMFRRMLQRAAFLHTGTADEAQCLAPLRLGPPIEVLPNGIFPEEFANLPEPGTFRRSRPALENRPYILFLGRLHHKKGLDYLADAFAEVSKRIPQAALVVAGPDDGEREPLLRRTVSAGLTDRVHVVGPLYGADKLAALVDAACFCLPSRQEGFSMAILEALACGIPAVISEHCHFPEIASSGAGYVVPLGDNALATALEKLLTDPVSARQMGATGAALVREQYTWQRIAERSIAAYRRHGATDEPGAH